MKDRIQHWEQILPDAWGWGGDYFILSLDYDNPYYTLHCPTLGIHNVIIGSKMTPGEAKLVAGRYVRDLINLFRFDLDRLPVKPPLGIPPKWLLIEKGEYNPGTRAIEILDAIERYEEYGLTPPQNWMDELDELKKP